MIDQELKFQACFFGDFSELQPTADSITAFVNAFRDKNLLPTTFQEIQLPAGPRTRLRLASPSNEWMIEFPSHRINVEKQLVGAGQKRLGPLTDFAHDAAEYFGRSLKVYNRKGTRLALVTTALFPEMNQETLKLTYSKLLSPLQYYVDNQPVAWNTRSVARLNIDFEDKTETLNIITRIDRVQGQTTGVDGVTSQFDRIQVEIDINTFQGNREPRFTAASAETFFERAIGIRAKIRQEVEDKIGA